MDHNKRLLSTKSRGTESVSISDSCLASWRETLVVTGSFMAAYTAFLAIQSLQSSLNQEAGLGVVSLACLYGTIILSGMLAPSFLRLVGAKWTLVLAWVCQCLYTGSNFYPTWATLIPASIVLGGISGPMWTSASLYLTTSAERIVQKSEQDLHAVLSKVTGVFYMCYESTQITGNLISSLVLTQDSYADNVTRVCGADDCPTAANASEIREPQSHVTTILLSFYLACDVVALGLTLFLLPPLRQSPKESDRYVSQDDKGLKTTLVSSLRESPEEPDRDESQNDKGLKTTVVSSMRQSPDEPNEKASQDDQGLRRTLVSWFTALSDPKLLCLVLFFVSSSMSQAIIFADYTKSYISCALDISMVGFILASHGAVTSAVVIATIFAAKYTGRYFLFGLSFVCNMAMLITLLLWKPNNDSYGVFFIIPTIWGIAVGIFHTQLMALVGLMFPEKLAAAFANYHTWNSIGYTITLAYGGVLCVRIKLYVCIVLFAIGMMGYITAEIIHSRQHRIVEKNVDVPPDKS